LFSPPVLAPDLVQDPLVQDPVPALALQEDTTNVVEAQLAVATLHATVTIPAEADTMKAADVDILHQEECKLFVIIFVIDFYL